MKKSANPIGKPAPAQKTGHSYRIRQSYIIGTKHELSGNVSGSMYNAVYEVTRIQGIQHGVPNPDEPVVFLRLAGRHNFPAQARVCITLSELAEESLPVTKSDKFYEKV